MPVDPADDTPLWRFSIAVYAADGVAAECLDLQDRFGLDVNLLLFAAYAGAVEGVTLEAPDIKAAADLVTDWHTGIVRALRGARRALKPVSLDARDPLQGAAAVLRARVKAAELDAEKIEQIMLWQWSQQQLHARNRAARDAALAGNLRALLAHYGAAPGLDALPRLHAAALAFDSVKS